jgi:hypothetical protein
LIVSGKSERETGRIIGVTDRRPGRDGANGQRSWPATSLQALRWAMAVWAVHLSHDRSGHARTLALKLSYILSADAVAVERT